MSLTERVSSATTLLEELRAVKAERRRQFADIQSKIEKITTEIAGLPPGQGRRGGGRARPHDQEAERVQDAPHESPEREGCMPCTEKQDASCVQKRYGNICFFIGLDV